MRGWIGAAAVLSLVVTGGLLLGGSAEAGGVRREFPVYGWVYGVPSLKAWKDNLPDPDKRTALVDENRHDLELVKVTHYPYEAGGDALRTRINFQRALHAALDDGWQIASVQGDSVLIQNPKRNILDDARRRDTIAETVRRGK